MPIYEFVCEACGSRFEELTKAGTQSATCPECGAEKASRVLSTPAATPRLVKPPGAARRQERRNAELQSRSKKAFGKAVRAARPPRSPGSGSG